jgi:hypothetical protein
MTRPAGASSEARIVGGLATALIAAAVLRLVVAVAAGVVDAVQRSEFPDSFHASDVVLTFGNAGDGTGVLLALAAAGVLWWRLRLRLGAPVAEWLRAAVSWVLALTALSALVQAVGYGLVFVHLSVQWPRAIVSIGFALAYALVAAAGLVAVRRLDVLADERLATGDGPDGPDALVFAVDRDNGDVQAFFSLDEAARRMHVYSIEENEFEFFTDEGAVVEASLQDGYVALRPTDLHRRDELIGHLREFVLRRGIDVGGLDADEPADYALPISDWQWLQLWPHWLRWMGMLVRRS